MTRVLLLSTFETLIPQSLLTTPLYLFPANHIPLLDLILDKLQEMKLTKFLICGHSNNYLFLYKYIRKRHPDFDLIFWKIKARFDGKLNEFGDIIREIGRRVLYETELFCDYNEYSKYQNCDVDFSNSSCTVIDLDGCGLKDESSAELLGTPSEVEIPKRNLLFDNSKKRYSPKEFDNLLVYQLNTFTDFNLVTLIKEHRRNTLNDPKSLFTSLLYKKKPEAHYMHFYGFKPILGTLKDRVSSECCEISFYDTQEALISQPEITYSDEFDGFNLFCISKNFIRVFYENFDFHSVEHLLSDLFEVNPSAFRAYGLIYEKGFISDEDRVIYLNQEMGFFEESEYINIKISESNSFVCLKNSGENMFLEQLINAKEEQKDNILCDSDITVPMLSDTFDEVLSAGSDTEASWGVISPRVSVDNNTGTADITGIEGPKDIENVSSIVNATIKKNATSIMNNTKDDMIDNIEKEIKYIGDRIEYTSVPIKNKTNETCLKRLDEPITHIIAEGSVETTIKVPSLSEKMNKILHKKAPSKSDNQQKHNNLKKAVLYSTIKYDLPKSLHLNGMKFYVKTVTTLRDYYELNIDLRFFEQISKEDLFHKTDSRRNLTSIGKNFSGDIKSVISNSIISDNCTVNSDITKCVLWSNVTVNEPLNYCIVFDNNQVVSINEVDLSSIKDRNRVQVENDNTTFSESVCKDFFIFQKCRNVKNNFDEAYLNFINAFSLLRIIYNAQPVDIGEAFAKIMVLDFMYFFNLKKINTFDEEMEKQGTDENMEYVLSKILIYTTLLKSYLSSAESQGVFLERFCSELENGFFRGEKDFCYKMLKNLGYLLMCEGVVEPIVYKKIIKWVKKKRSAEKSVLRCKPLF
ncbi:hypothetical protein CDIK_1046 [Cucumispora dikerogammari]|nr:hypothetical protein CDIK_1046 [Cucumispora dikerogammari]